MPHGTISAVFTRPLIQTGQTKLTLKLDFPGNLWLAAFAILAMFILWRVLQLLRLLTNLISWIREMIDLSHIDNCKTTKTALKSPNHDHPPLTSHTLWAKTSDLSTQLHWEWKRRQKVVFDRCYKKLVSVMGYQHILQNVDIHKLQLSQMPHVI